MNLFDSRIILKSIPKLLETVGDTREYLFGNKIPVN